MNYTWNMEVTGGSSWGLEKNKCISYLQERQEGRYGMLQADHPHLDHWKGNSTKPFGDHFDMHEAQKNVTGSSLPWFVKEKCWDN